MAPQCGRSTGCILSGLFVRKQTRECTVVVLIFVWVSLRLCPLLVVTFACLFLLVSLCRICVFVSSVYYFVCCVYCMFMFVSWFLSYRTQLVLEWFRFVFVLCRAWSILFLYFVWVCSVSLFVSFSCRIVRLLV